MKAQNVLADEMNGRPILLEACMYYRLSIRRRDAVSEGRYVVRKRVEPDVHYVSFIIGNREAPGHRRLQTTDRQILQSSFDECNYFVASCIGTDLQWIGLNDLEQLVAVIGQPEKIALFGDLVEGPFVDHAIWNVRSIGLVIFILGLVRSARCAEPAL